MLNGIGKINGTGHALATMMAGDSGADILKAAAGSIDAITDFNVATDTGRLENADFSCLAGGAPSVTACVAKASGTASDTQDRIRDRTNRG